MNGFLTIPGVGASTVYLYNRPLAVVDFPTTHLQLYPLINTEWVLVRSSLKVPRVTPTYSILTGLGVTTRGA